MRKLSIKAQQASNKNKPCVEPIALSYDENGSFFVLKDTSRIQGSCINCKEKPCMEYSEEELLAPFFDAFPHNTSKRVCPTTAISINADNTGIIINTEKCIACGLCVHRCPTAAIQLDLEEFTAFACFESSILEICTEEQQNNYIIQSQKLPHYISYSSIPESFAEKYQEAIQMYARDFPDLGEIIVRNTLVNMGIPTKTKAKGNNHNRTEFFGQQGDSIIIGETNCNNADVLTISRRILDDEAVIISRYKKELSSIVPLSVINGFPNKRTDYYEVVHDINAVLGIQIYTISFYVLFILNLFGVKLSIPGFRSFVIDSSHQDLLPAVNALIPGIDTIDNNSHGVSYRPIK